MTGQIASKKTKEALRKDLLERRLALSRAEVSAASEQLCARLASFRPLRAAEKLAGYAAIRAEIDLSAYLDQRHAEGAQVFLPRVEGPGEMVFAPLAGRDELIPGPFGVAQPSGLPVSIGEIDVFLVPGVAFDRGGNRLGFGGGYYDRALRRARSTRAPGAQPMLLVGVCYDWQLLDARVPAEEHDIAMDVIITDQQVFRAGRR